MSLAVTTLPKQLDDLRGEIYRLLPPYEAERWQCRFDDTAADADLSRVWDQFSRWLLLDDDLGVIQYARTDDNRDFIHRAKSAEHDAIYMAAIRTTADGYAAAYGADPSTVYRCSAYPEGFALYTAAHINADRADWAVNAHAIANMAAGKTGVIWFQAEHLLKVLRSQS